MHTDDDDTGASSPEGAPVTARLDESVTEALAMLASSLDMLCAADPHELTAESLYAVVREVETASRRLAAVNAAVLVAVECDGRWAADGSRSLAAWVRRATDASPGRAHRQTRTARALREHLPVTAHALREGAIGTEHAELLAKHTTSSDARIAGLGHEEVGEAFLVEQAAELDAGDFARLLRRWAVAADPEAADREWKDEVEKEHLVLAKSLHGYHLQGWLSDAGGAALDEALRARSGVPSADDTRTTAQRRAGALVSLARLALDSGVVAPGAAIRPHLTVHVPYGTLERLAAAQAPAEAEASGLPSALGAPPRRKNPMTWRGETAQGCKPASPVPGRGGAQDASHQPTIPGRLDRGPLTGAAPAELDDGTPLPHALLARLACDSELARVVFGPASEILDSGRTKRLFTPGQRRAIIARDRSCRYPGCGAPAHEGEIHHSIWWYAQYGSTRAQDGVLLCWFHHDHVHAHGISIERATLASAGRAPGEPTWQFRDRNGRLVGPGATGGAGASAA